LDRDSLLPIRSKNMPPLTALKGVKT